MRPIRKYGKAGVVFIIILCAHLKATGIHSAPSAQPAPYCMAPEYRQFDFWIGDWDAFDVDRPSVAVARTHVDRILDGCVLREDYQDTSGHHGQSFSLFDASRKLWHQSWVTNRGELLLLDGKFEDGQIILAGEDRNAEGKPRRVRGIWKKVNDGVRETAFRSLDDGKTWQPWFDLIFRAHQL